MNNQKFIITLLFIVGALSLVGSALAITNIDSTDKYAWNDYLGWINLFSSDTVNVTSDRLEGFAFIDDNNDEISFDCATSPAGDICGASNYFVGNDGIGNLDGWAWNDSIGWISFCGGRGGDPDCPDSDFGSIDYQVTIDPNTKEFEGWAWNDKVGWISFNCNNQSSCGTSDYKVVTNWVALDPISGWLISNTFDTGITEGAGFNSIMWLGDLQFTGNSVKFQLATSNCENGATDAPTCSTDVGWGDPKTTGDGAFIGSDGTSASFYGPSLPGVPNLIYTHHANKRYYRYKVYLDKGSGNTVSPIVEDVIVNWSR